MELIDGNDPILRTVSEEVPLGHDVSELVRDMWATINKTNGVGLAANQVGVTKRVIIVKDNGFVSEIINPKIVRSSGKKKCSTEGCLSYPGRKETIKRESIVWVEGYDVAWNPIKKKCRGLLAFIIQHEIDHLDGITIKYK